MCACVSKGVCAKGGCECLCEYVCKRVGGAGGGSLGVRVCEGVRETGRVNSYSVCEVCMSICYGVGLCQCLCECVSECV